MRLRAWMLIPVAILALLIAACGGDDGGSGGGGDSPADAVRNLVAGINDRDGGKLYDNTSKACLGNAKREDFIKSVDAVKGLLGDLKLELESADVKDENGDSATVEIKGKALGVPGDDGETSTDTVELVKEDGKWKIKDCSLATGFIGIDPSELPTAIPTGTSTSEASETPTGEATDEPTAEPTGEATDEPTTEPTDEPTDEPTGEATDEPTDEPSVEPTGTLPPSQGLPDGYPENVVPILEGGSVTSSSSFSSDGVETISVVITVENMTAEDIVDFYKGTITAAGWKVTFSGTSSDGGSVFASKDESDPNTETISVFISNSFTLEGALEAGIYYNKPDATSATGTPGPDDTSTPTASLPEGYPDDIAPLPDGATISSQSNFESNGVKSFIVIYSIEGMDAEAIIDFYKDALSAAGWETVFSGTTTDTEGTLIGGKTAGDSSNSLVVSTAAGDADGVIEVSLSVSIE